MEKHYKITKEQITVYKIRLNKGGYWGDISIDEGSSSGRIQIASDYGSWQNYWGACGKGFKEFLIGLDIEYFANKVGEGRHFDLEKTLQRLGARANEEGDKDEILAEIETLTGITNGEQFAALVQNCSKIMTMENHFPDMATGISPLFQRFWDAIWSVFVLEIKEELELETQVKK